MKTEEKYMWRAIQLAKCGVLGAPPNPVVGAVIVHEGRIIGEGYHRRCGGPHAEVNAIRSVRQPELLRESTMYVTLEPCAHYGKTPPCADLIVEKGIPHVVVGCQDPFGKVNGLGLKKMRDAGVDVEVGMLERECLALVERFVTFHSKKRPWIILKWARTADGFIAREGGRPVSISTPCTQALVHRLRVHSQAIMVGTKTVLTDNPSLNARLWPGKSPLRVTIDRHGILPSGLKITDDTAPTCIYDHGDLEAILHDLHERGVQTLLVEGGKTLLDAFIGKGLWDEARVETNPGIVLGEGVESPLLTGAAEVDRLEWDGNEIKIYRPQM